VIPVLFMSVAQDVSAASRHWALSRIQLRRVAGVEILSIDC